MSSVLKVYEKINFRLLKKKKCYVHLNIKTVNFMLLRYYISHITYDFTFHVYILRFHWDFFIFYFRMRSHIPFLHFALTLSDRLPVRVKSDISKDLHSHKKLFFNKIYVIKTKKITYFNRKNPKITQNPSLFQRFGQCKLTAIFLRNESTVNVYLGKRMILLDLLLKIIILLLSTFKLLL